MKIYKYPLTQTRTNIEMPLQSRVLCVQMQNDIPTVWAMIGNEGIKMNRTFVLIPTGFSTGTLNLDYIGTVQHLDGIVFHVFEIVE